MRRDDELQDGLRRLARSVPREAGGATERELRVKFRAQGRRVKRASSYLAELAAVLVALAGLFLTLRHGPETGQPDAFDGNGRIASEFVALPYAQNDVPMEQPVIVRMKISAAELGSMGMPVHMAPRSGNISADLLIGQDGVARAVRLIE